MGLPGQTTSPHHTDIAVATSQGRRALKGWRGVLPLLWSNFNTSGDERFVCNRSGSRPSEKFQIFCGVVYDLGEYGLRPGSSEIHFAVPTSGTSGRTGIVYAVAKNNGSLYLPRVRNVSSSDYEQPIDDPKTLIEERPSRQTDPWAEWRKSPNNKPVRVREREIKVRNAGEMARRAGPAAVFLLRMVLRGVNAATESADLIWAIYWALPPGSRGPDKTPLEAAQRILENWRDINIPRALRNIITNQLEDELIGRAGQGWTDYRKAVWDKYGIDIGSEPGSTGFGGLGGPGTEQLPGLEYFFPEEMKAIGKAIRDWENGGPTAGDFDIIP